MTWFATLPAMVMLGKEAVRAIFAASGSIIRLMSELMSASLTVLVAWYMLSSTYPPMMINSLAREAL